MALRAVPDHPKFAHLQVALRTPKWSTLGALECIWHFTGRFTPQGNIGKYSDEVIEKWCEWDGEPGLLVRALTDTGWLDHDATHRLIVHDWSQHADKATRMALGRAGLGFIVPTVFSQRTHGVPTAWGLPVPVPVPVPVPDPEPEAKPNTSPKTGSCERRDEPVRIGAKTSGMGVEFEEVWPLFWIRTGKGAARSAWIKARKKANRETLESAIVAQGPSILAQAKQRGSTPVHPSTWLNQERWEDDVGALEISSRRPVLASKTEQAMVMFDELMMRNFERASVSNAKH